MTKDKLDRLFKELMSFDSRIERIEHAVEERERKRRDKELELIINNQQRGVL